MVAPQGVSQGVLVGMKGWVHEIRDIARDGTITGSVDRNEGLGEICDIARDGSITGSVGRNEGLDEICDIGWDGNITGRNKGYVTLHGMVASQ